MSDVTMDQKLKLVQQVRARYHENQYDMSSRERILYGRTSAESRQPQVSFRQAHPYDDAYDVPYGDAYPAAAPLSSLRVRLFIALLLLTMVVVMDKNDMKVAGIAADQIFQAISADYEEVLEAWVETASQAQEGN